VFDVLNVFNHGSSYTDKKDLVSKQIFPSNPGTKIPRPEGRLLAKH
jgi:hypothetical protein